MFLVDACVLRDYLAEFYAGYGCTQRDLIKSSITSMSGLRRKVLERMAPGDTLADDLRSATATGGWLHELGEYRNLVVHCVPLARADASLFVVCNELIIEGADRLASISFPLPKDPAAIAQSRASGAHFRQDELALLVGASRDTASADALIYAYNSLARLVKLSSDVASRTPVQPQIPQLTEKDIIGEIKVNRI